MKLLVWRASRLGGLCGRKGETVPPAGSLRWRCMLRVPAYRPISTAPSQRLARTHATGEHGEAYVCKGLTADQGIRTLNPGFTKAVLYR
jgi:hypothetical protein